MSSSLTVADGVLIAMLENDSESFTAGLDAGTGVHRWKLARPRMANWVAAGALLYCVNEKGLLQIVGTTAPEGAVTSEVDFGGTILSTPSIAHDAIYVRSDGKLWKLGRQPRKS